MLNAIKYHRALLFAALLGLLTTAFVLPACGPDQNPVNNKGNEFWDTLMPKFSRDMSASSFTYVTDVDQGDSAKRLKTYLVFNGVKWRDRDNFVQRGISYVAFHTFDAMPDSMRKKYSALHITLNTDSGKFEQTLTMEDIAWPHFLSIVVDGFYRQVLDSSFAPNLDQRFIDSSLVDSIVTMVNKVIPGTGKIEHQVIGFQTRITADSEWLVLLWTRCSRDGKVNEINFTLSAESLQIVDIRFPFGYMTW